MIDWAVRSTHQFAMMRRPPPTFLLFTPASIQHERGGVDAITQPGGLRTIVENMAKVRAALLAAYFHTLHAVAGIGTRHDAFGLIGLPEARPARTGNGTCGWNKKGV